MWEKIAMALGLNPEKRHLGRWEATAHQIEAMEQSLSSLDDEALRKRAQSMKSKVSAKLWTQLKGDLGQFSRVESSADVLVETFAIGREASRRLLGMRHFKSQLIGGMVLHEGKLAEMKTGEGKSLALTLPAILNALAGVSAHVVTVNEYLARRDAKKMKPLYEFFGLSVGLLEDGQSPSQRREEHQKDVVYGVNHEFGFDYLRHNMAKQESERRLTRGLGFAIVDEVDSILIDEARTPLIISGQTEGDVEEFRVIWSLIDQIEKKDLVEIELKERRVTLTEKGFEWLEKKLMSVGLIEKGSHLYEAQGGRMLRMAQACLGAKFLHQKNQHYIVHEGKVVIVDEFTGRLMPDRRWGEGLHQAIEAKEGVDAQSESKTLASVTYQNFFKRYQKLAGLTGTAMTQAGEFWEIYGLESVRIPTHKPMIRKDQPDVIYRSAKEKYKALAECAREQLAKGRPVLAGTASIEESERLSEELTKLGIEHQLLNAKNHEREAQIIEQAGEPGRMTVATNMAGRGTDIVLGGSWESRLEKLKAEQASAERIEQERVQWNEGRERAIRAGGLLVLGTARNESRRVDNQLRGRSGRQGDPGESRFFISLEDELFRVYAQNGVLAMIDRHNLMPEGSSLEHPIVSRALERAQALVESQHFDMRKQLLEYDEVGSHQREAVYAWRDQIMDTPDSEMVKVIENVIEQALEQTLESWEMEPQAHEAWVKPRHQKALEELGALPRHWEQMVEDAESGEALKKKLLEQWIGGWKEQCSTIGVPAAGAKARAALLGTLDELWVEHLTTLQELREGIHLRAYAQKDPKQEYKKEARELFELFKREVISSSAKKAMEAAEPSVELISAMRDEQPIGSAWTHAWWDGQAQIGDWILGWQAKGKAAS